jgi:sugar phosphate permease
MTPFAGGRTGRWRWYIGGLLFLSTVVNYIDRQTFSVLGPYLKTEFAWTNTDFALIIISFRVAYTLGQVGAGPLLDRLGTRTGLTITATTGMTRAPCLHSVDLVARTAVQRLRAFA